PHTRQVVAARAGQLHPSLDVDQPELHADGGMVLRRKVEMTNLAPFLELDVLGVILTEGNVIVRRLRQQKKQWQQRKLDSLGSVLRLFHPYLEVGDARDGGLSCGYVLQRGNLCGGFILLGAQAFERLLASETLSIELQHM